MSDKKRYAVAVIGYQEENIILMLNLYSAISGQEAKGLALEEFANINPDAMVGKNMSIKEIT
jgi:hypothetical protein